MDFIPLNKRVLIFRDEALEKTESGIILPESVMAKEAPSIGTVVASSRDATLGCMVNEAQVGDKVLFGRYSGVEVEIKGKTYLVVDKLDLLGVVERINTQFEGDTQ